MIKNILFVSVVSGALSIGQLAMAGDIQLRPTGDAGSESSPPPATSATQNSNTSNSGTFNTQSMTLQQRVTRLERILNSQSLQDMLSRMDTLQGEVESLRGQLQVQNHQLEELKQRQRDLYVDIDRRLTRLERNGSGTAAAPGAGTGNAAAPAAVSSTVAAAGSGAGSKAKAPTPVAGNSSAAPVDAAGEQQAYQKAFDTLRDLRYSQAVKEFRAFIAKYPKGRYAHIAQYWIAEAEYAQRKFKQAISDYQKLIDNYPNSPKLAEAMLKIGYSQYELNNNKDAITILNELIKSYPGTTEAGQAQNLLRKIRHNQ
ncbi:MAG: tol-pal system protein YbgF [Gammaproteobacteria bacterium]|jgi:tol-pal system protein YbgF